MNMHPFCRWSASVALALAATIALPAAPASLTVEVSKPGVPISPMLYGLFFEEINLAGDGGLYAELVRNRSFEDAEQADHWTLVAEGGKGEIGLDSAKPLNPYNRKSLKLRITQADNGRVGVANGGYWGIPVTKGSQYLLSLAARSGDGFKGALNISIESEAGQVYAQSTVDTLTENWQASKLTLTSDTTDPAARLVISAKQTGTVWLDMVSLFPKETWKGRPNGLRPDLANMLVGLHPAFVRFPGGCWVEGHDLKNAYRWKETIGAISERRTQYNLWQYNSTHGLGYLEYLMLCEDLGAEPLFVINVGMSHTEVVPMDQMGSWVQDALDAIEYANGHTNTIWGGLRAKHGHPDPFHLKYMEIGNENGGPAYHERYALFHDAIKARHRDMKLVADEWSGVPKNRKLEIVDEHYYSTPEFFINNSSKYDTYDRAGHKVYVGEYAVTQGCGQGNLIGALGEAVFMTGMERNSDVVVMASYAPLFANIHYKKWNPDLIDFDGTRVYGIPSYYVQQMFAGNRGDVVLPLTIEATAEPPAEAKRGGIGLGTWDTQAEFKDLRVTQGDKVLFTSDFTGQSPGWAVKGGNWKVQDGAFQQTGQGTDKRALAGDPQWSDYTYSLKARKLSGAEGFLVMFQVENDNNWLWWNLGGWGNSRHAIERCENGGKTRVGNEVAGKIETGRWYDIRIELQGQAVRCYLDGKLVHDVSYPAMKPLYGVANWVQATGEVILKVVNVSKQAQETRINLAGIKGVKPQATAIVLTSAQPLDENTIDKPDKVVPTRQTLEKVGPRFTHAFPAYSLTVMRLETEK